MSRLLAAIRRWWYAPSHGRPDPLQRWLNGD
jgi:hypothetical protein